MHGSLTVTERGFAPRCRVRPPRPDAGAAGGARRAEDFVLSSESLAIGQGRDAFVFRGPGGQRERPPASSSTATNAADERLEILNDPEGV